MGFTNRMHIYFELNIDRLYKTRSLTGDDGEPGALVRATHRVGRQTGIPACVILGHVFDDQLVRRNGTVQPRLLLK